MLAVVLFCVLLKVVVLLPAAALTVTVPLMQCPFRLSPGVLRTVDGIIAGHIGQQLKRRATVSVCINGCL